MYREKSKKQAQTQHLYDTLKKRVMTSQVQTAASDSVAQAIKSMSSGPRPQTFGETSFEQPLPTNFQSNTQRGNKQYQQHSSRSPSQSSRHAHVEDGTAAMPPPQGPMVGQHNRKDFRLKVHPPLTSADGFAASTPQHRIHLPGTARTAATRSQIPLSTRAPATTLRQPLANTTNTRNSQTGSSGYGMTVGMKVGRAPRSKPSNSEQRPDRFNGNFRTLSRYGPTDTR
jgi:hypothetical protein